MKELLKSLSAFGSPGIFVPALLAAAAFAAIYFLAGRKKLPPEPAAAEKEDGAEPPPAAPGGAAPSAAETPAEISPPRASVPEDVSAFAPPPSAAAEREAAQPPPEAEPAEPPAAPEIPESGKAPSEDPRDDGAAREVSRRRAALPETEPVPAPAAEPEKEEDPGRSFFDRLSSGLSKTRRGIFSNLESVFSGGEIDDAAWDEFEEILIMSDMGVGTTAGLREKVSSAVSPGESGDVGKITALLKKEILEILRAAQSPPAELSRKPTVFMVAGVNGVGKTTSIGKIAHRFTASGKRVMVAAADTFRAAAVEQLGVWAKRVGSDFIRGQTGADPSAVAYDAVRASVSRGIDLLIIDTAGRVHTKTGLMDELGKLRRVVARELEGAPHETLLVLDATTGQNAVEQARTFDETVGVTGIVLTKLDGTAKGGIIVAIAEQLGIPVKYVGVGEGLGDLREFDAEEFAEALFAPEKETVR